MYDLTNIFEVFLPQLLTYPNPTDPLNGEAAALQMREPERYKQKVREYVQKYAKPEDFPSGSQTDRDDNLNNGTGNGHEDDDDASNFSMSDSEEEHENDDGVLSVTTTTTASASGASASAAVDVPAPTKNGGNGAPSWKM